MDCKFLLKERHVTQIFVLEYEYGIFVERELRQEFGQFGKFDVIGGLQFQMHLGQFCLYLAKEGVTRGHSSITATCSSPTEN